MKHSEQFKLMRKHLQKAKEDGSMDRYFAKLARGDKRRKKRLKRLNKFQKSLSDKELD